MGPPAASYVPTVSSRNGEHSSDAKRGRPDDKFREAVAFLNGTLGEDTREKRSILAAADRIGISESTLRRAKDHLRVIETRTSGDGNTSETWALPSMQKTA